MGQHTCSDNDYLQTARSGAGRVGLLGDLRLAATNATVTAASPPRPRPASLIGDARGRLPRGDRIEGGSLAIGRAASSLSVKTRDPPSTLPEKAFPARH